MSLVFRFIQGYADAGAGDAERAGGKGAHLGEMCRRGLPVPPGLTITTECSRAYHATENPDEQREYAEQVVDVFVMPALKEIAEEMGYMPLLAVRSGSPVSMPGMMDTVLNVGMNRDNLDFWIDRLGEGAAYDCYRRLLYMYGRLGLGYEEKRLAQAMKYVLNFKYGGKKVTAETIRTSPDHLRKLAERYEWLSRKALDGVIKDPAPNHAAAMTLREQLVNCTVAVWESWMSERAIAYRAAHDIPDHLHTAVNIQAMVFGNMNEQSGSGVLFTRDPATGAPGLMGEFVINGQGEDVVSGAVTPRPLSEMELWLPDAYAELKTHAYDLERHYSEMQDMEFTVEDGKLWILQCRTGKRSRAAHFRIVHDMHFEGLITTEQARARVSGDHYLESSQPRIADEFDTAPTFVGIGGSVGIATGVAVFNNAQAEAESGATVLIRNDTSPEDFPGMAASVGILTAQGGQTSHAAVVARAMDKPCVVGVTSMVIGKNEATVGETTIKKGDMVTINGATGEVWFGVEVPVTVDSDEYAEKLFNRLIPDVPVRVSFDEWNAAPVACPWVELGRSDTDYENALGIMEYTAAKGGLTDGTVIALERDSDMTAEGALKLLTAIAGPETPGASDDGKTALYDALMAEYPALQKIAYLRLPEMEHWRMAELKKHGWRVLVDITSAEDVLDSDGGVLTAKAKECRIINELIRLKKKAGEDVAIVTEAEYKSLLVYEAFTG